MTLSQHSLSRLRGQLSGERGLLLAIVLQAFHDAQYGPEDVRQDAMNYFAGDIYQQDLELLGLPADFVPALQ